MAHMQFLLVRSHNPSKHFHHVPGDKPDDDECEHMAGHALMATAPPNSHIMERPNEAYPHKMPDLGAAELSKLLDLSNRLPIDRQGEVTPVMAWTMVLQEPKIAELEEQDFLALKQQLAPKVKCYGYVKIKQA